MAPGWLALISRAPYRIADRRGAYRCTDFYCWLRTCTCVVPRVVRTKSDDVGRLVLVIVVLAVRAVQVRLAGLVGLVLLVVLVEVVVEAVVVVSS